MKLSEYIERTMKASSIKGFIVKGYDNKNFIAYSSTSGNTLFFARLYNADLLNENEKQKINFERMSKGENGIESSIAYNYIIYEYTPSDRVKKEYIAHVKEEIKKHV